ncbi:MAG: efflux RND transporter periplasmic adaptor subunit [Candidatus Zambryskibacteria bacterium]|nr:efflux RND transporter periplasmic adaptor subunit [Candidatus Zambryskibacteria bacterium]
MKRFLSKKSLILVGLIVVLAITVGFSFGNGNGKQRTAVVRADIIQEVAATGKVKPNQSVDLGFDKSGRVENVYIEIGNLVERGQVLATLESEELRADLAKAKASLAVEEIKLREIKNTAPISYNDAKKNLEAVLKSSFADADNAVRNKADQFFKNPTTNPQFETSITSGSYTHYFNVSSDTVLDINNNRKEVETILIDWTTRISGTEKLNLVSDADKVISDLNEISDFLDKVAAAVNTFISSDYTYEATVASYKTTIATAREEISSAISSIVTAKDKLNSAPIVSGDGQFGDVLSQEAAVTQAKAAVTALEASLTKSVIRAPFDGIVTTQNAKVGSAVSAGQILISLNSKTEAYIEANISEIHIGKIKESDPVFMTFDAFPDREFGGVVSYIEPGDFIIDGIVNYKIRVNFLDYDEKIKNGLTVNLKIQTAKKENVLAIPLYAVSEENGQNMVKKLYGKNIQKIPVQLGLMGNDGLVEILNGLEEGDILEF